jgi:hypothetical protein
MPANGFIGFITSQGFFIGIIFAVLKFDDPIMILIASLVVTGIFYMLGQISVSYFVRAIAVKSGHFPKNEHEYMLDEFAKAIQKRENIFDDIDPVKSRVVKEPEMVMRSEEKEEQ